MPIFRRIDSLKLRVEVAFLVNPYCSLIKVRLCVRAFQLVVNLYAQSMAFFLADLRFLNAIAISFFRPAPLRLVRVRVED